MDIIWTLNVSYCHHFSHHETFIINQYYSIIFNQTIRTRLCIACWEFQSSSLLFPAFWRWESTSIYMNRMLSNVLMLIVLRCLTVVKRVPASAVACWEVVRISSLQSRQVGLSSLRAMHMLDAQCQAWSSGKWWDVYENRFNPQLCGCTKVTFKMHILASKLVI